MGLPETRKVVFEELKYRDIEFLDRTSETEAKGGEKEQKE